MIKGIVFDLDATLVNLGEHVEWNKAKDAAKAAYVACGCDPDAVQRCDHGGLHDFLNDMNKELEASPLAARAEEINEVAYGKIDEYEMKGVDRSTSLVGVAEALEWLRTRGIKMAICTTNSTEVAERILEKLGLLSYFTIVVGRTPSMPLKPCPEPVQACLAAMHVQPSEAVMIGDSHKDIQAGKAASTWTIAVPVRFTRMNELEKTKPDAVLKNLGELPDALLRLEQAEV